MHLKLQQQAHRISEVWAKGGEGGIDLAKKVLKTLEEKESNFKVLYPDNLSLKEKVETIAKEIYGADGVTYEPAAEKMLAKLTDLGFGDLPVCMAKTQYSLSDDQTKLGRPEGFDIHVRDAFVNAGAGFVVILTGAVMTMPGLPKKPAAFGIDVDDNGKITGLFQSIHFSNTLQKNELPQARPMLLLKPVIGLS